MKQKNGSPEIILSKHANNYHVRIASKYRDVDYSTTIHHADLAPLVKSKKTALKMIASMAQVFIPKEAKSRSVNFVENTRRTFKHRVLNIDTLVVKKL